MLYLNTLLETAEISPRDVYLVRHKDTRIEQSILRARKSSPYDLWIDPVRRPQFELYQQLQGRRCFSHRPILASFVVTPSDETLFVGMYRSDGVVRFPDNVSECPVSGKPLSGQTHVFYQLTRMESLNSFVSKMTVEWGDGYHSWIQRANLQNKRVLEIRRDEKEEPFPGFRRFKHDLTLLEVIPAGWRQILQSVKGIYLLTCKDCGRQYVGKADGPNGFWGRFLDYPRNSHGGNAGMKKHRTSGYFVTILEAIATPREGQLDELETCWKNQLETRKWGLNEN